MEYIYKFIINARLIDHLAPTRLASPSMFSVPITFVFIVCWRIICSNVRLQLQ